MALAGGGFTFARTSTIGGRSTRARSTSTTSRAPFTRTCGGGRRWRYPPGRSRAIRRTADGRRPVDTGTHYFGAAVHPIRASDAGSNSSSADAGATLPRVLDVSDLTVLTGWAEAVAETLAHAPERIPARVEDVRPGAAWRSELGIAEPSQRLVEAIESLDETMQAAARPAGTPTFDAVLAAVREDRSGEQPLDELVRAVLRSTLEQLRSRQVEMPDLVSGVVSQTRPLAGPRQ